MRGRSSDSGREQCEAAMSMSLRAGSFRRIIGRGLYRGVRPEGPNGALAEFYTMELAEVKLLTNTVRAFSKSLRDNPNDCQSESCSCTSNAKMSRFLQCDYI